MIDVPPELVSAITALTKKVLAYVELESAETLLRMGVVGAEQVERTTALALTSVALSYGMKHGQIGAMMALVKIAQESAKAELDSLRKGEPMPGRPPRR
jgi:hypothetical protein